MLKICENRSTLSCRVALEKKDYEVRIQFFEQNCWLAHNIYSTGQTIWCAATMRASGSNRYFLLGPFRNSSNVPRCSLIKLEIDGWLSKIRKHQSKLIWFLSRIRIYVFANFSFHLPSSRSYLAELEKGMNPITRASRGKYL